MLQNTTNDGPIVTSNLLFRPPNNLHVTASRFRCTRVVFVWTLVRLGLTLVLGSVADCGKLQPTVSPL